MVFSTNVVDSRPTDHAAMNACPRNLFHPCKKFLSGH
ncbi:MAG: hypothetical protein AVDCRST_MAG93-4546 [uncultured Chloroflexia bacterium]|uniref:Uncharacterized protein n=1 Tax=uncultured Chloroflexia bacterium TaxID=1672391 RepID=A0A6J4KBL0_9CHLR|nr:MAG: hypothetical protein AVDCRST_MAG93-4546 [uncultured Chloroflexia bacterium]